MSVTAAVCIGITVLFLQSGSREDIALLDPTGRPVAHVRQDGGRAYVKLLEGSATRDAEKLWHLWGMDPSERLPVHIGVLLEADLMIEKPERFAGYAVSMEDRGFAGTRPVGPFIALTAEK